MGEERSRLLKAVKMRKGGRKEAFKQSVELGSNANASVGIRRIWDLEKGMGSFCKLGQGGPALALRHDFS